jgi:hypothetical protein
LWRQCFGSSSVGGQVLSVPCVFPFISTNTP